MWPCLLGILARPIACIHVMSELAAKDFEALSGRPLAFGGEHGTLSLWVRSVQCLRQSTPRSAEAFSVVLHDRGATHALPQGIYRGDLGPHGAVDIFIVPIGPDAEGMRYEAVFN